MGRHTDETKSGGGFKPECGIHNVICCQVVDLGTHDTEWEGKVTGKAPMINYTFEFVDEEREHDGEKYHPMWGIREQKRLGPRNNIRKFLEGWRGKEFTTEEKKSFDWGAPLGKSCQLVISPNQKGNPKLTAIVGSKMKLTGTRELHEFWIDDDNPEYNLPEWMPEWMQKLVKESYEYTKREDAEFDRAESPNYVAEPDGFDDIPF